jgi:hypothetical protein
MALDVVCAYLYFLELGGMRTCDAVASTFIGWPPLIAKCSLANHKLQKQQNTTSISFAYFSTFKPWV